MEAFSRLAHRAYSSCKDILALGPAIILVTAVPAHAGSTGSTSPLTPQGNNGGEKTAGHWELRVDMSSSVAATAGVFPATVRAEQDRIPATAIAPDPESDYWFWDFLQAGDATYGARSFPLDAPAPALVPGQGSLRVRLHGASTTGVAGEHHAAVRLNGTEIGEMRWEGLAPSEATFHFGQELLRETGNQVEVAGLLDAGVPYSILYVDSFELVYKRLYRAAGDTLTFGSTGTSRITVSGFSSPEVRIVEVSDRARPRWITGATVDAASDGYRVSFVPPSGHRRYVAAAADGIKTPGMRLWNDAELRSQSNAASYLVIAPAGMRAAAERLAALRQVQGLEVLVVDLEAVMDEFNFGQPSPQAVREFLAYAWSRWRTPPRYVALVGAVLLAERFYLLAAQPGMPRLGDLILRSLAGFDALGGDASMPEIYNLLGDPALRLRRAGSPPASGGIGSGE